MYNDIVVLSKLRKVFEDLSDQFGVEKLEEGYSLTGGFAFKSVDYKENGHFVLRVTNIMPDGSINNKDAKFISNSEVENYKDYSLSKGDVLIVMIGGSIGKVGYVSSKHLPALLNQNLWKITSKNNLDNRYVFYLALYICFFYGLQKNTSYAFYSRKKFKEINVPKITRDDSLRVAKFLDEYLIKDERNDCDCLKSTTVKELFSMADSNNLISLIKNEFKSQQNLLKKLRQQILQDAIKGKLTKDWREQNPDVEPASELLKRIDVEKQQLIKDKKIKQQKPLPAITDAEKPFSLPENWEWARLGDAVQFNPRNKLDNDLEVSFVPMKLIEDGYANSHKSEIRTWKQIKTGFTHFSENDVAISKITPCFQNRKSCVLKGLKNKFGAGTTELFILRKYSKTLIPEFLLNIAKTVYFIDGGVATYKGTVGQQRVQKDFILKWIVALPPYQEQKEIVKKVEKLFAICDQLEEQIASSQTNAEQLMQSVLKEAFSQDSAA